MPRARSSTASTSAVVIPRRMATLSRLRPPSSSNASRRFGGRPRRFFPPSWIPKRSSSKRTASGSAPRPLSSSRITLRSSASRFRRMSSSCGSTASASLLEAAASVPASITLDSSVLSRRSGRPPWRVSTRPPASPVDSDTTEAACARMSSARSSETPISAAISGTVGGRSRSRSSFSRAARNLAMSWKKPAGTAEAPVPCAASASSMARST
mmetsp:Transcript_19703/g.59661  ORF Transcript_19703/g.59661 Transcript_19703/m.59661 type:complete len:212 (+) Transcript_19703:563-1198(+)